MRRVAFVVPRYGAELGGGAEEECRRLAELLAADLDVTVLTSWALDYRTWADHYPAGEEHVGGVRVLRFGVTAPRQTAGVRRAQRRGVRPPGRPRARPSLAAGAGPRRARHRGAPAPRTATATTP